MSLQHFDIRLRIVCLGMATCQVAASSQLVEATPEFASLAGAWKGQGEILANWTTPKNLTVNIRIEQDGKVTGTIGNAEITSGRLSVNRGITRVFIHSDYTITASLGGPLLEADGIVRRDYNLRLSLQGANLLGFGASDGNDSWPGASRESRIRGAMIQVTRLVLERL
jgi:uncharacterized protein (DUF2147 family)